MRSGSVRKLKVLAIVLAVIQIAFALMALPSEPRPWLCRDKPVFSDNHPMQYQAAAKGGDWQIFFMQFQMNAAHDGFSIKESHELGSAATTGTLPSGQYYAVA